MSILPRSSRDARHSSATSLRPFCLAAVAWALIITLVTGYLAVGDRSSFESQAVGNLAFLVALLFGTAMSAWAARRQQALRKAWSLMALSWFLGALGQVWYTVRASSGAGPSPVFDTFAYLSYAIPVIAALFAFPKPPTLLISRFRSVLDALVITVSLVFISEATVLRPVREATDLDGLAGWYGLAYPIADLAICSVVFTLGMRQPARNRATWLCLGSGLVALAVTDSIYVRLAAEGQQNLTATPLMLGWMAAPVLAGLATLVPQRERATRARDFTLAAQLVPYVPVWGAIVVLATVQIRADSFLLAAGILLLTAVTVRQVMIVYENVSLTRNLEAKVAARTAELATLGSIVTSSSDAIVGVSLDNVVTAWNPAAERLYGHSAAEVVGRSPAFLEPSAREAVRALLDRAAQEDELGSYELDWPRPDGTTVPVALRVSSIRDGDTVRGISIFGQDITDRRRVAKTLERAREEALESSRLKSEFLATMSHEIRTPMNGVIGLTSLLLQTELDHIQRQYAEGVRGAGEALLSVINDILDFSKLEAGKVVLDPADFDPRRLVEDVGALLAPAAFAKHLELVAYCLPEVPRALHGDAGRIRQILLNLASNAVKFTSEGEVAIRVRSFPLDDGRVKLRFDVSDTGIGIAEQDRGRLFESFSQADASTTRRFGGTGLGLAICRRLVEVMEGELGLDSQLGAGSNFWFEIPLPVGEALESVEELPTSEALKGLRVLVVDDNATNRGILEAQLTSWRMDPELVENAASALAKLRHRVSVGEPYDLVVLDMFMPDIDGLQLARAISNDPALSGTPMIMLTSSSQLEPGLLQEAGIGQWLTKPLRSSELYDRLIRLIAAKEPDVSRGRSEQRKPADPPQESSSGRILVVEDNSLNQLVAEGVLSRLGYQVHSVSNGLEAVQALEAGRYSAVLMDCHMPVMDGFTATREIRRNQANGPRIPIIAMTAGALAEDRDRCLAAGMDDYVSKPVDLEALKAVLARWVTEQRSTTDEPASTGEAVAEEPAIDQDRLESLRALQGPDGSSLLDSLIEAFLRHSDGLLGKLKDAARVGDDERLAAAAHELKGAASTIGATQVAALAGEIESQARRAARAPEEGRLAQLGGEIERAKAALQQQSVLSNT